MKKYPTKIYFALLLIISILLITWVYVILHMNRWQIQVQDTLSDQKKIESSKESPKVLYSTQRQEQLAEIQEFYTSTQNSYRATISQILSQYKSDISETDMSIVEKILKEGTSQKEIGIRIESKLWLSLLSGDIQQLVESSVNMYEEENIYSSRLENFKKSYSQEQKQDIRNLIELISTETLSDNDILTHNDISQAVKIFIEEIFENNNLLDSKQYPNITSQKELLISSLQSALKDVEWLTSKNKENIGSSLWENIELSGVLWWNRQENTSLLIPFVAQSYAAESYDSQLHTNIQQYFNPDFSLKNPITSMREKILTLQIQILIDRIIARNIEISLTKPSHKISTQDTRKLSNLAQMLQTLNQNNNNKSTSDETGKKDDSDLIKNLDALAYVSKISGSVQVVNLKGGEHSASNSMLLYPWYKIKTLSNSSASIIFSDASILRLDAGSTVTLTAWGTNPSVVLDRGNIWTRVVKPLISWESFEIKSWGVSLWVRGTAVYMSKASNITDIYIVDSWNSDNTASANIGAIKLIPGKKIRITNNNLSSPENFSKLDILKTIPKTWEYERDDLHALTLLLDDIARGFYNNPLAISYDGKDYESKLLQEITNSLPKGNEKRKIFKNTSIADQALTVENIYYQIQKDKIISELKAAWKNTSWAQNIDFLTLETSLWNKREIERRFDLGILQDIVSAQNVSATAIENIFTNFDISKRSSNLQTLQEAQKELSKTFNKGSSFMTSDIFLPNNITGYKGVQITWSIPPSYLLLKTNNTLIRKLHPHSTGQSSITATLSLWNLSVKKIFDIYLPKLQLSDREKLSAIETSLQTYFHQSTTLFGTKVNLIKSQQEALNKIAGSEVEIKWIPNTHIVSQEGHLEQPSYNSPDRYSSILAKANISFWKYSWIANFSNIKIARKSTCLTTNKELKLDKICYGLVASAEYDSPGEINLIKTTGEIISANSKYVVNQKCSQADKTGNCGWDSKKDIASKYNYTLWDIWKFDKNNSWMEYGTGAGIVIDNEDAADSLSYNLSSLNLGNDWAIEMSVRGEDLKRSSWYYLFSSPPYFAINSVNNKIRFVNPPIPTIEKNTSKVADKYVTIWHTKNKLYLDWIEKINYKDVTLSKIIKIWSDSTNSLQWNWVINYLKLYKKN